MLASLAGFLIRRRIVVLAVAAVVFALAAVVGRGVAENLTSGGYNDPNADSTRAATLLDREFTAGTWNLVLLVTADSGIDDASVVEAGRALTQELAREEGVANVVSYWSLRTPTLASRDGTQALVLGRALGDVDEASERAGQLAATYTRNGELLDVAVGGTATTFRQVAETIESDLRRAEFIAFPAVFVLLLLIFGSAVAALLPLAVGVVSIIGAFAILQLLTGVTDVAIYALNLAIGLGLGLAIDYSLFIVSRFREELAGGDSVAEAIVRTMQTAGKTVAFSGGTVAISLSALLLFPQVFMRSFAYAGSAVTGIAVISTLVILPALLAVLGRRVDSFRILRRPAAVEGEGRWHRIATAVMRRPISVATVSIVLLLLLGAPFLGVEFGTIDDRVLPADDPVHLVVQELRDNFSGDLTSATSIVAPNVGNPYTRRPEIDAYATALSSVAGVARVDALTGSYREGARIAAPDPTSLRFASQDDTWLAAVPAVEPVSPEAQTMVAGLRAVDAPFDDVVVGGPSAEFLDSQASLFRWIPVALGAIAVVTFVLLFLMFGSLVVPTKAVVMNTLSLTAMFGAMVWIFQDGHLSGLLDFTATGTLDMNMPVLMFALAFGISMDYEVFLLSRIKEEYDRTGDNTAAVAVGLEKVGRIVTAAAVLLAVVFSAFATSGVTLIKLFGVGLTIAIIIDATVVRAALVPAFMRLAGDANWWLPGPLRRFYERYGISEGAFSRDRDEPRLLSKPSAQ